MGLWAGMKVWGNGDKRRPNHFKLSEQAVVPLPGHLLLTEGTRCVINSKVLHVNLRKWEFFIFFPL